MLIDARTVEQDSTVEADVCIIGAGAAGITIARELNGTSHSVCLLESGGFELEPEVQALYEGASEGTFLARENYLTGSRLRFFGGTTNHWAGWCRPLDPLDFEVRSWVPHSGWPFSREHLEPYYRRAAEIIEIHPFDFDPAQRVVAEPSLLHGSDVATTKVFHFSPPTRFGQMYRDELTQSPNVTLYHHANVRELKANESASAVEEVDVTCLTGTGFKVRARRFVLATGGIENARMLLLSDSVQQAGLGNQHDLVGRFFADHPHMDVGNLAVTDPDRQMDLYEFYEDPELGHRALHFLTIGEEAQRREHLLNLRVYLRPRGKREMPKVARDVGHTASHLDRADVGAIRPAEASLYYSVRSRLEEFLDPQPSRFFALDVSCETEPNPESRVTLIQDVDALGMRRVQLNWVVTEQGSRSVRRSIELIGQELGRHLQGRAQVVLNEEELWPRAWGGSHHLGTTRMHDDPRRGVVDARCRVHGIENLYVGGSSVFPTYGFANPTLTITALALRIAEDLKRELAG